MNRDRLIFIVSLVVAALLGLGIGWWLRGHPDDSTEHRARAAAQHLRDAFRSLTH
jgi:cytochrome bd-type quinol oxidase subunit 2